MGLTASFTSTPELSRFQFSVLTACFLVLANLEDLELFIPTRRHT